MPRPAPAPSAVLAVAAASHSLAGPAAGQAPKPFSPSRPAFTTSAPAVSSGCELRVEATPPAPAPRLRR